MSIEMVEDKQNKKVFFQLDQLEERTKRGIRRAFFRLGADLIDTLSKDVLAKNKTGRTYIRRTRSGARRRHVASAPGQSPANRTGMYRRNRGYKIKGSENMEFGIREFGEDYPRFLEEGTSKMDARPGLGNAVSKTTRNADKHFSVEIERELKME